MSAFDDVRSIVPRRVWDGITARAVHGERLTLAVVELEPGASEEESLVELERVLTVLRRTPGLALQQRQYDERKLRAVSVQEMEAEWERDRNL